MSAVFVLHPNVGLGVGILFSRVISVLRLDLMRCQRLVTTEQYTIDTLSLLVFLNYAFWSILTNVTETAISVGAWDTDRPTV